MAALPKCQPGDTSGFPIKLSQSMFQNWPLSTNSVDQLRTLTVPTDFTIQWGSSTSSVVISVTNNSSIFQIRGISSITQGTTLTYGTAIYSCSEVLSIVQNQHKFLTYDPKAIYEIILAFQIINKSTNPSSPDVILVTRPIVFSNYSSSEGEFWGAVNKSVSARSPQGTKFNLSNIYGYNASMLLPMITYQTCLPVKLRNYLGQASTTTSISVRVNVVVQPITIVATDDGLGKCSIIKQYTLVTEPKRPVDIFPNASANTVFQFRDGYGDDLFPLHSSNYYIPQGPNETVSAFKDIIHKFQILVPEAFLGKSLGEIADVATPPPVPKKKKAFKCYRIDPEKDIKNDQILVDPQTGQSLHDTMKQEALESAGGDPTLAGLNVPDTSSGLMPGDIQQILLTIFIVIGTIIMLSYLGFIAHTFLVKRDLHNGIYHFIFLILIIIVLSLIGAFIGNQDK